MSTTKSELSVPGVILTGFTSEVGEVSVIFERKIRNMFEERFSELDPEESYPLHEVEGCFEEILEEVGPKTLELGGKEAGKSLPWVDDADSLVAAVRELNENLETRETSSGTEYVIGRYTFEQLSDETFRGGVTQRYPFTEPYALGVYEGIVEAFSGTKPITDTVPPEGEECAAWKIAVPDID